MLNSKENRSLLTADDVRRLFTYEKDTGILRWKVQPSNNVKVNEPAGSVIYGSNKVKYMRVGINGVFYLQHRIIWLWVTGEWPKFGVDHQNGCGLDNRFENLRDVTSSVNSQNRRLGVRNKSGHLGVSWNSNIKKWKSAIVVQGKLHHLGYYTNKEDAIKIRKQAEADFMFHKNHGKERDPNASGSN